nr:protein saal1 isoform X1 [Ipomoea batatas]GMD73613.1 protein saal1 isoform X1 [Ipomoea batatas]
MKLGLPCLMVDLLSFEMGKLREERLPERYSVLDLILQTFEALSVIDESSQEICASKRLFLLLTDLIKLPENFEVADSCVTAAVLLANILTDAADLALEIFQDLLLLQGLFSLFPFASADAEARSALWSIIARLLIQVQEIELSPLQLHQYVSIITSETEVIEEELLDHQSNDSNEECGSSATLAKLAARNVALNGIVRIISQWMDLEDRVKESLRTGEYHVNKGDAYKLLHCCGKYIK